MSELSTKARYMVSGVVFWETTHCNDESASLVSYCTATYLFGKVVVRGKEYVNFLMANVEIYILGVLLEADPIIEADGIKSHDKHWLTIDCMTSRVQGLELFSGKQLLV
jgi:hypothetical protein